MEAHGPLLAVRPRAGRRQARFRKNLIAALLKDLTLPDPVWSRLTWGWVGFLVAMGIANLYVAANFTTDTWVNFKVWGGIGLFMLAAVGTVARSPDTCPVNRDRHRDDAAFTACRPLSVRARNP